MVIHSGVNQYSSGQVGNQLRNWSSAKLDHRQCKREYWVDMNLGFCCLLMLEPVTHQETLSTLTTVVMLL